MNACPARCRNACIMIALVLFAAGALPVRAGLKLPGVFQDNMVLQRDMPVPVWGRTDPGMKVTVSFCDQTKTATADPNGNWSLKLDPLTAGGPFQLRVEAGREVMFTNLLVGDVWLCSGQSNMARSLRGAQNAEAEIAAAKRVLCPRLHLTRRRCLGAKLVGVHPLLAAVLPSLAACTSGAVHCELHPLHGSRCPRFHVRGFFSGAHAGLRRTPRHRFRQQIHFPLQIGYEPGENSTFPGFGKRALDVLQEHVKPAFRRV